MRTWISRLSLLLLFGLTACPKTEAERAASTRRLDNVVRVFMHTTNYYSFLVREEGSKELRLIWLRCYDTCRFFEDVESGKPMWVKLEKGSSGSPEYIREIHLRSSKDLEGGGWSTGKGGRGMVNPLE